MSNEYRPIKVGKSGTKVHAGIIKGYSQKGHYSEPTPIYDELCNVVNTKNINQTMLIGKYALRQETPITCAKCLRILAEREAKVQS